MSGTISVGFGLNVEVINETKRSTKTQQQGCTYVVIKAWEYQ